MALQSRRINEIYPNRKPFMEAFDGKRKAAGKDLRVQALLAQEASNRQCIDGILPQEQEQQPPAQEFLQQQDNSDASAPPTDFSGFFHKLQQEKQQTQSVTGIYQEQHVQQQEQEQQQHAHQGHSLQQQQHHHQLHELADQQQRSAAPTTLEELLNEHDLNSRIKPPDRELKQMISLDRVFGADTSRDGFIRDHSTAAGAAGPPCTRSNSSATAAAAAAAAAKEQQQQQHWHLTGLLLVPWDWSVKSSVRLSSPQPFNVLQEVQDYGLDGWCRAVAAAGAAPAAAGAAAAGAGAAAPCSQERLQQALMQWQHPASALPAALLPAALPSTNGTAVAAAAPTAAAASGLVAAATAGAAAPADVAAALLLRERVQQWREALRAAYISLRHGLCPVIYICGQAFKQPFTAALCAPGVMDMSSSAASIPPGGSSSSSSRCTALLSRSNRQLRAHLATYGCEVLVAGQLEQQHAAAGQQQQHAQRKHQQQQQQLSAAAFDGQPGSQLLLVGSLQVHSLYAALLALPWCGPGQPDVPLLCAPVQFLHAQLCPLRLVALPDALLEQQQQQQRQAAAAGGGGGMDPALPPPLHYVELRGSSSIMPWTLHRLLQLLQDTQGLEGFQAYLGIEPCSSSLNVLPELWVAAAAGGRADGSSSVCGEDPQQEQQQQQEWQRRGRGLSAEEAGCWGSSVAVLQGRVLRQLRVEEGNISAKLA